MISHEYKDYAFYLGFALEAEAQREYILAAHWLIKALAVR